MPWVRLADHLAALAAERELRSEQVTAERDKASVLLRESDLRALAAALDAQHYRNQQYDGLRARVEIEHGGYATRRDLDELASRIDGVVGPLQSFISSQRHTDAVRRMDMTQIVQLLALVAVAAGVIFAIVHG